MKARGSGFWTKGESISANLDAAIAQVVNSEKIDGLLCAILNSSLITWLVTSTALTAGVGLSQWKKFTIERIPIPENPAREARSSLVRLVDDILAAKDADPGADVTEQEKEIDHLVYTLYGLSEAEIAAIEKGRP